MTESGGERDGEARGGAGGAAGRPEPTGAAEPEGPGGPDEGRGGPGAAHERERDLLGPLRPFLRTVRHAPDRLLHPWRRRRARRRLSETGPPERVVFLCVGNICRSPYAAEVFRRRMPGAWAEKIRVESMGFYPVPDRPSPGKAVRAAGRRGVDLSDHRSRVVGVPARPMDILAVGMTPDQARRAARRWRLDPERALVLGDLDPLPIERRVIQDPWGREEEVFDAVYERIDRCVEAMAGAMFG